MSTETQDNAVESPSSVESIQCPMFLSWGGYPCVLPKGHSGAHKHKYELQAEGGMEDEAKNTSGDVSGVAAAPTVTLKEALAALAHEQWSGWMEYLFEHCFDCSHSPSSIVPSYAAHWQRQMRTPYAELSEQEKDSDRKEADRVLAVIQQTNPTMESKRDVQPTPGLSDPQAIHLGIHRCITGGLRRYPSALCSACLPGQGRDYDWVQVDNAMEMFESSLQQTESAKHPAVESSVPSSPSGIAWEKWFKRLGIVATSDVVNATATLVIEEREIYEAAIRASALEEAAKIMCIGCRENRPFDKDNFEVHSWPGVTGKVYRRCSAVPLRRALAAQPPQNPESRQPQSYMEGILTGYQRLMANEDKGK